MTNNPIITFILVALCTIGAAVTGTVAVGIIKEFEREKKQKEGIGR